MKTTAGVSHFTFTPSGHHPGTPRVGLERGVRQYTALDQRPDHLDNGDALSIGPCLKYSVQLKYTLT